MGTKPPRTAAQVHVDFARGGHTVAALDTDDFLHALTQRGEHKNQTKRCTRPNTRYWLVLWAPIRMMAWRGYHWYIMVKLVMLRSSWPP